MNPPGLLQTADFGARRPTALAVAAALLSVFAAAGCGTSIDPAETGVLCAPADTNCPSTTTVSRDSPGSNVLDIVIHNRGPAARVSFTVRQPGTPEPEDAGGTDVPRDTSQASPSDAAADATADTAPDATSDVAADPDTGPSLGGLPGGVFPQSYTLGPDEKVTDRFPATEVFTEPTLELALVCRPLAGSDPCRVTADYVLLTEPLECQNTDDCRADRKCNTRIGKCVECTDDADCDPNQSCHTANGRCLPRKSSGCTTAPGGSALPVGLPLLAVFLGAGCLWCRRRHTLVVAALLAVVCVAPSRLRAAPPISTLSVGGGPRLVTGELGDLLQPGLGVELRETLRTRWVGASAWIEAGYFLTRQPAPPLTRETTLFGFGAGARGYIPIRPVEIVYGADYRRIGFAPNTLIRETGDDSNFNAVGATLGVAYQYNQLELRVDGSFAPILGLPGSMVSINLSVGVASRARD